MKTEVKYALGLVLAAFLVVSGWYARTVYEDHLELQINRVRDAVSLAAAEEIAKIKIENKTIYNKTVEKIKSEVQYRECVADPVTVELTNKAIMGEAWK